MYDEEFNFEKLICELQGRPYRPKPKTFEEKLRYDFEDAIRKQTDRILSFLNDLKAYADEIQKENKEFINKILNDISNLYNNDKIMWDRVVKLENENNELRERIEKLEMENRELRELINQLLNQQHKPIGVDVANDNVAGNDKATHPEDKKELGKKKILELIKNGINSSKDLRANFGMSIELFYECIRELLAEGIIKEIEEGKRKYYKLVSDEIAN